MNNTLTISTQNKYKGFCILIFSQICRYLIYFYDASIERMKTALFLLELETRVANRISHDPKLSTKGLDLPTSYRQSYP